MIFVYKYENGFNRIKLMTKKHNRHAAKTSIIFVLFSVFAESTTMKDSKAAMTVFMSLLAQFI